MVDTIFAFLEQLTQEGIALLLVEQYVTRALGLASSVYVLHKGEVAYSGPAGELDEEKVFALYSGDTAA